jgi:hypothetical protein
LLARLISPGLTSLGSISVRSTAVDYVPELLEDGHRRAAADGRVIISCQVFAIGIVWQLAEAGAGTSIRVNVTAPESEARRLDRQHQLIEESLRRLTAHAEAAS